MATKTREGFAECERRIAVIVLDGGRIAVAVATVVVLTLDAEGGGEDGFAGEA